MNVPNMTATATFGNDPSADVDTTGMVDPWLLCWAEVRVTDYSLREAAAGVGLFVE